MGGFAGELHSKHAVFADVDAGSGLALHDDSADYCRYVGVLAAHTAAVCWRA